MQHWVFLSEGLVSELKRNLRSLPSAHLHRRSRPWQQEPSRYGTERIRSAEQWSLWWNGNARGSACRHTQKLEVQCSLIQTSCYKPTLAVLYSFTKNANLSILHNQKNWVEQSPLYFLLFRYNSLTTANMFWRKHKFDWITFSIKTI